MPTITTPPVFPIEVELRAPRVISPGGPLVNPADVFFVYGVAIDPETMRVVVRFERLATNQRVFTNILIDESWSFEIDGVEELVADESWTWLVYSPDEVLIDESWG